MYLEPIQRKSTIFILNDFKSNFKIRLIKLRILPPRVWFEYPDIMFFIMKCIKILSLILTSSNLSSLNPLLPDPPLMSNLNSYVHFLSTLT